MADCWKNKTTINRLRSKAILYNIIIEFYYELNEKNSTAEELLATSNFTLGQIAMASGFQDKTHLSHVFKNRFGLSPFAYRKKNQTQIKREPNTHNKKRIIISNLHRITYYDNIPERIVCLSYPEAELCAALGLADKIIGIASAERVCRRLF